MSEMHFYSYYGGSDEVFPSRYRDTYTLITGITLSYIKFNMVNISYFTHIMSIPCLSAHHVNSSNWFIVLIFLILYLPILICLHLSMLGLV